MIGRLRGTLLTRQPPWLVLEVGGVGYELEAPMSTIYNLPPVGREAILLTHQVVRDDSVLLYGFLTDAERRLFRQLLKVGGIGPRIALAVLSGVSGDEFARLVHANDATALTRIPGIGKKTAERIVMELRDRIDAPDGVPAHGGVVGAGGTRGARAEAQIALQQLGYKPVEAVRLVAEVADDEDGAEAIIRKALRIALGS